MVRPSTFRERARLLVVVGVAALGACAPRSAPLREAVLRYLAAPAEELFDPAQLVRLEEVVAWDFALDGEAASWRPAGEGAVRRSNRSVLILRGTGAALSIERDVAFDAGRVQVLRLTHRRLAGAVLHLDWAAPGEPFAGERRITARPPALTPTSVPTTRFTVGGHPHWRGTVGRLRLTFEIAPGRIVHLRRLAALSGRLDAAAHDRLATRPWLVRLGGDTRSALLAAPGTPVERELTVPPAATFETALGVTGTDGGSPLDFRVVFAEAGGGEPTLLVAGTAGGGAAAGWQPLRVDLARFAGRRGSLRLEATAGDPAAGGATLAAWAHPEVLAPAAAGARPPSVVLVSIDTLRADRLSLYGHHRPTSPRLDAWARRRAVVFETAVAAAPWTVPAHTSMFTGLEAYRHGVNHHCAAPAGLGLLAERFHAAGYRTQAVTGGGVLAPEFGLAQGFDAYYHHLPPGPEDEDELVEVTRRALAALDEGRDRPQFLFVHTYAVHAPYRPRRPYFRRFAGARPAGLVGPTSNALIAEDGYAARSTLRRLDAADGSTPPAPEELATLARDLYDSGVAYADEHLGRLLAAVDDSGLDRRTVVVVTSDHGEMLGEHGLGGHGFLYDENLLVPLVVASPDGRGAGGRVARQVRQVDVAPTILELAGLALPRGLDGRSLAALLADPHAADGDGAAEAWSYAPLTNHGAALRIGGRLKLVLRTAPWPPTRGRAQLFDLARDPREERPLAEVGEALRRRLVDELDAAYRGLVLTVANAGPAALTAELRGEAIVLSNLHSLDLDCDCLTSMGPFRARLELPAGHRFTLRLENPAGTGLDVDAAVAGVAASARLDFSIDRPAALAFRDGGWHRGPGAAGTAVETGLTLGWRDPVAAPPQREDDAGDRERREQLRALGYLR